MNGVKPCVWKFGLGPKIVLIGFKEKKTSEKCCDLCVPPTLSYTDTEQYEDAVRDYEKVYQTEKTKGKLSKYHRGLAVWLLLTC